MMYPINGFPDIQDSDPENHVRLLTALLSVAKSACPALRHQVASRSEEDSGLTRAHARTPVYPPQASDPAQTSLNIGWLRQVLSNGLPFALTQRIFSWNMVGFGYNTSENQCLSQLTAYVGFNPIPVVDAETNDTAPPSPSHQRRAGKNRAAPKNDKGTEVQDMSETAQRARARERARPRAFYMDYLSRRRNWGPYLAVLPHMSSEEIGSADTNAPELHAEHSDSDMEDDEDYVPPDDASQSPSSASPEPGQPPSTGALLTPEQLRPDWAWLAAARVVAECKLRQHVDAEDVAKLEDWDNLRGGVWVPDPPGPSLDDEFEESAKVQETDEPGEEWRRYERDWAGAEGIWRSVLAIPCLSLACILFAYHTDVSFVGSITTT